jgi:hypothetical protein
VSDRNAWPDPVVEPDPGCERCYECDGKRFCWRCDGAGTDSDGGACPQCDGSGHCIVCTGAGQLHFEGGKR